MSLHIIGIGYKKEHINPEMLKIIKNSEKIFLEYYTSFYQTEFKDLENYLEKNIEIVDREIIETQIEKTILKPSKEKDICLLVIGDPLIATTHTDLILRAKSMKITVNIYHNISIANLITRTGLQFYKFGKITSIPFFSKKFMPRTPYITYQENKKINAHTLFLLDLNPSNDIAYKGNLKYLYAHSALEFLLNIQDLLKNEEINFKIEKENSLSLKTKAIICSRLGFDDEKIIFSNIDKLIEFDKEKKLKEPLCLIIPAKLHEMEKEYLNQFKI